MPRCGVAISPLAFSRRSADCVARIEPPRPPTTSSVENRYFPWPAQSRTSSRAATDLDPGFTPPKYRKTVLLSSDSGEEGPPPRGPDRSATLDRRTPRTRRGDLGTRLFRELQEILDEHIGELRRRAIVRVLVTPGRARLEDLRRHALDHERNLEAEDHVAAGGRGVELAAQRRIHHPPRERQGNPFASARRAAGPAGVDQPNARVVLAHLLAQHARVDGRVERHERRREAGAERRLRLGHAALGAR